MTGDSNDKSSNPHNEGIPKALTESEDGRRCEQSMAQNLSVREALAQSMQTISDFVNSNLILVRYATLSSVVLLGAYSISQTPLFFRYRHAKDIPTSLYGRRSTLNCRVFQVDSPMVASTSDVASSRELFPIVLHLKHLSPVGLLLSRNHFELGSHFSPTAIALGRNDAPSDLIRVQLYGVSQDGETFQKQNFLLQELAGERALVRCQIRAMTTTASATTKNNSEMKDEVCIIARLAYWPNTSWRPVDLGTTLVKSGLAVVQHDVQHGKHSSGRLPDKRRDIEYLELLSKFERNAIANRFGMWSIERIRAASKDVLAHIEWVSTATWYQKLWHHINGRR